MYNKGIEYAKQVVSGEIVAGKWVRLGCKKILDDLSNPLYYLNEKKLEIFNAFCSLLHHYQSGAAGKPFILEPWQELFIIATFCIYNRETNLRKYKEVYLSISRKNGKSTLAGVMVLFSFMADGEAAPSIVLVANSRDQAKIDLDICQTFSKQLDPSGKTIRQYRNEIKIPKLNALLKTISADSGTADGMNLNCFLCDEIHEYRDSKMYDVLKSSQGFRTQPLSILITTSGFNMNGFCYNLESYYKEILEGIKEDETVFPLIYQLDEGDDWTEEYNWIKANPNLGTTINIDWLREQVKQAQNSPTLEIGVRTKNLNQWVSSSNVWIAEQYIKPLLQDVKISSYNNDDWLCYAGFDLSAVSDLTALSLMFVNPSEERYVFKTWYYLPKTALENKYNSELYKIWARNGFLIITDSKSTDYNYIQNQIEHLYDELNIQAIAFDSWNSTQLANNLVNKGLPMKPFSQAIGNFNKPTKEFERLVLEGKVIIDNNPITRFCLDNVELRIDSNGNAKPDKANKDNKIDGVISMLQCLGQYLIDNNQFYGEAFVIPNQ